MPEAKKYSPTKTSANGSPPTQGQSETKEKQKGGGYREFNNGLPFRRQVLYAKRQKCLIKSGGGITKRSR